MNKLIIEDFQKDYPNVDFPYWEEISNGDTYNIINKFFDLIQVDYKCSDCKLKLLYSKMKDHPLSPIKYCSIDINILLKSINAKIPEFIYINWYRLENLDKMKYIDFQKYIFDLWYGIEDIEIFSENLDWALALTHFDVIKFVKIP